MAGDSDNKPGESHMNQAVSQFMVPVTVAWLLAAGGLLSWDLPLSVLVSRIGKLATFLGSATAFLTVVLALVEDAVPADWKRKLMFPLRPHGHPSYGAFEPQILARAEVEEDEISDLKTLRTDDKHRTSAVKQQERWWTAYQAYRSHPAVAHYAQRWVAWQQTAPLLLLLTLLTLAIALIGPMLGPWIDRSRWLWFTAATAFLSLLGILSARSTAQELVAQVVKQIAKPPRVHSHRPHPASVPPGHSRHALAVRRRH